MQYSKEEKAMWLEDWRQSGKTAWAYAKANGRIFIRPGYTDLRKAVNGLSVMIEQQMKENPFSGSVYIFCNRERKLIKAVYWDKSGFWLSQKRLEKDRFSRACATVDTVKVDKTFFPFIRNF